MITNKRVKELIKEAECVVEGDGYGDGNIELLIQMIVRECAEVGYDSVEDGDDIDDIMRRVHNNILKHFGVKA